MILSASKRQNQSFLLLAQLSRDRLLYIEAMNDKITPVIRTAGSVPGSKLVAVQNALRIGPAG